MENKQTSENVSEKSILVEAMKDVEINIRDCRDGITEAYRIITQQKEAIKRKKQRLAGYQALLKQLQK